MIIKYENNITLEEKGTECLVFDNGIYVTSFSGESAYEKADYFIQQMQKFAIPTR